MLSSVRVDPPPIKASGDAKFKLQGTQYKICPLPLWITWQSIKVDIQGEVVVWATHQANELFPVNRFASPGSQEVSLDVNLNINWVNLRKGSLPTIASSSVMFLLRRKRELHGAEAMACQGFPLCRLQYTDYTHKELSEMAGDAFNGFVFTALFISLMKDIPFSAVQRLESEEEGEASVTDSQDGDALEEGGESEIDLDPSMDEMSPGLFDEQMRIDSSDSD